MDKWNKRFMDLAEHIATWSSCLRRQVGAIVVKDKRIMTTGYNGAPTGVKTCIEKGFCIRNEKNISSGTHAEICYAAHAERISLKGCVLYCTHQPCVVCAKMIINAGIKEVIFKEGYPDDFSIEICHEAGVKLTKYEELEKEDNKKIKVYKKISK